MSEVLLGEEATDDTGFTTPESTMDLT